MSSPQRRNQSGPQFISEDNNEGAGELDTVKPLESTEKKRDASPLAQDRSMERSNYQLLPQNTALSNQNAAVPVIRKQSQLLPDIHTKNDDAFNPTNFEKKNFFEIDEPVDPTQEEKMVFDSAFFEQQQNLVKKRTLSTEPRASQKLRKLKSQRSLKVDLNQVELKDRNPEIGLTYIDKVKLQTDLSNQRIVPFDRGHFLQCLVNPNSTKTEENDEIITVQFQKSQLKPFNPVTSVQKKSAIDGQEQNESDQSCYSKCAKDHPMRLFYYSYPSGNLFTDLESMDKQKETDKKPENNQIDPKFKSERFLNPDKAFCDVCDHSFDDQEALFACYEQTCAQVLCTACNLKYYKRHTQIQSMGMQQYYEKYSIHAIVGGNQKIETNQENTQDQDGQKQSQSNLSLLPEIDEDQRVQSLLELHKKHDQADSKGINLVAPFAKLVPQASDEEQSEPLCQKKAIIGFWKVKNQSYVCYRTFEVKNPLFFKPVHQGTKVKYFLHLDENNEIFYFQYNNSYNEETITVNKLKLQLDIVDKKEDLQNQSIILATFDHSGSQLYFNLLQKVTGMRKEGDLRYCTTLPQLITKNNQQYLVVTTKLALGWENNKNLKNANWCNTSYRNILFVNLKTKTLDFTIYNADLLLKVQNEDKNSEKVWFMRDYSVVEMEWGTPVKFAETLQSYINASKKKDKRKIVDTTLTNEEKATPPKQIYLNRYFLTFEKYHKATYYQNLNDLQTQIKQLFYKKILSEGRLHMNGKRVSIIFQDGNIFTFQLEKRQNYTSDGVWIGDLHGQGLFVDRAKFSNQKSTEKAFEAQGKFQDKHSHLHFTINGQIKTKDASWSGYYMQGKKKIYLGSTNSKRLLTENQIKISFENDDGIPLCLKLTLKEGNNWEGDLHTEETDASGKKKVIQLLNKVTSNDILTNFGQESVFYVEIQRKLSCDLTLKFKQSDSRSFGHSSQFQAEGIKIGKGEFDVGKCVFQGSISRNEVSKKICDLLALQRDEQTIFVRFDGISHQNRANKKLMYTNLGDAQFCFVKQNDKNDQHLFACGDLEKIEKQHGEKIDGYSQFQLNFYDLDSVKEKVTALSNDLPKLNQKKSTSNNESQKKPIDTVQPKQAVKSRMTIMECLIPNAFKEIKNENGQLEFTDYLVAPPVVKLDNQGNPETFTSQIFYKDVSNLSTSVCFLNGKEVQNRDSQDDKILTLPQWPCAISEDFIVQWPLLAYKSANPQDNELVICNLADTTKPQKLINIAPYRFLQFIETGFNPEKSLQKSQSDKFVNSCVFMLVELRTEEETVFRILYYKHFPYELSEGKSSTKQIQSEPQFNILKGDIWNYHRSKPEKCFKETNRLTKEKIKSSTLLHRQNTEGVSVMLVVQLIDGVVAFNLNKEQPTFAFNSKGESNDVEMLPFLMQRGPYEEVYYVEKSENGNTQVICLTFKEKEKLTRKVVKSYPNESLLAIQLKLDGEITNEVTKKHAIYLLDSDFTFLKLQFSDSDVEPVVSFEINIKNHEQFASIHKYLDSTDWSSIILSHRGIKSLQYIKQTDPDKKNKANRFLTTSTINFKSSLSHQHEFLGFSDDIKIKGRKGKVTHTNQVLNVYSVPWINQEMVDIQEGGLSYFRFQPSVFSRRVDLMRADQTIALQQKNDMILIVNDYVGVYAATASQYLIFSQKDFKYIKSIPFTYLNPLTDVHNREGKKEQYFEVKCRVRGLEKSQIVKFVQGSPDYIVVQSDLAAKREIIFSKLDQQPNIAGSVKEYNAQQSEFQKLNRSDNNRQTPQNILPHLMSPRLIDNQNRLPEYIQQKKFQSMDFDPQKQHTYFCTILTKAQGNQTQENDQIQKQIFEEKQTVKLNVFKFTDGQDCTLFAVVSPYVPDSSNDTAFNFFLTSSFAVINIGIDIYFTEFKNIDKIQGVSQKIKFQRIETFQLPQRLTDGGIAVFAASDFNVRIAEKGEYRYDVVQVSAKQVSFLWDLDEDKEVIFCEKPRDFFDINNFTHTGLIPHSYTTQGRQMSKSAFIKPNEDASILVRPSTIDMISSTLFRTYSNLDFLDITYIRNCEKKELFVKSIDFDTVLANFNGITFFMIFRQNQSYLDLIQQKIVENDLKSQKFIDINGNISDNIVIRKIFWQLILPLQENDLEADEKNQIKRKIKLEKLIQKRKKRGDDYIRPNETPLRENVLQEVLFDEENQHMLDPLIILLRNSEEFRLSNIIASFDYFQQIYEVKSQQILSFLTGSFFENECTQDFTTVKWKPGQKSITFSSQTSLLSVEQIRKEIQKQQLEKLTTYERIKKRLGMKNVQKLKTVPVEVKVLEIEWLSTKKALKDFYNFLADVDSSDIFDNYLIKTLLEQNDYTLDIVLKAFLPFLFFFCCSIVYCSYHATQIQTSSFWGTPDNRQALWLRLVIIIFGAFLFTVECVQMYKNGKSYWTDFWNYLYHSSIGLTLFVVFEHSAGLPTVTYDQLMQIASVTVILLWAMLFYWLRLFPELAYFVSMIWATVQDCANFFIMFLICVFMFGNANYILNWSVIGQPYDRENPPDPDIYPVVTGVSVLDALVQNYNAGIGSAGWTFLNGGGAPNIAVIYYLVQTIFTNMMFLNMLIAIMGDTYARITEFKDRNGLQQRTQMFADFLWSIKLSEAFMDKRYLFVVTPTVSAGDGDEETDPIQDAIDSVREKVFTSHKKIDSLVKMQTKAAMDLADLQSQIAFIKDKMVTKDDSDAEDENSIGSKADNKELLDAIKKLMKK